MTRSRLIAAVSIALLVALVLYVARHTEWYDVPIPTPPKGDAVTNPFYAAQRFAEALGATTRRQRVLEMPPAVAVLVVSAWHWDLTPQRQAQIAQWVESGGRLVVDRQLTGDLTAFESWSGIGWDYNEAASDAFYERDQDEPEPIDCAPLDEVVPQPGRSFTVCDRGFSFMTTARQPEWALRDAIGHQALRVSVGLGSVTVINSIPFTHLALLEGDHAALFVAATQLKEGDDVVFLTEGDHPSLLALLWASGAPAVLLFLAAVACYLWRGAARFGPTIGIPEARRRSIAEQIHGSGYFALKFGEGAGLHAAAVRALTEAAHQRIPAYERLSRPQRTAALGQATGMDGAALIAALEGVSARRPKELPNTLALIETARRQLLHPRT